jgi:hypothetical protein
VPVHVHERLARLAFVRAQTWCASTGASRRSNELAERMEMPADAL